MRKFKLPKKKIVLHLSFGYLLLSFFAQLYFSNRLAIKGLELARLNIEKMTLDKEVSALEYEKSQLASISAVEERSKSLGFVAMTSPLQVIDFANLNTVAVLVR